MTWGERWSFVEGLENTVEYSCGIWYVTCFKHRAGVEAPDPAMRPLPTPDSPLSPVQMRTPRLRSISVRLRHSCSPAPRSSTELLKTSLCCSVPRSNSKTPKLMRAFPIPTLTRLEPETFSLSLRLNYGQFRQVRFIHIVRSGTECCYFHSCTMPSIFVPRITIIFPLLQVSPIPI